MEIYLLVLSSVVSPTDSTAFPHFVPKNSYDVEKKKEVNLQKRMNGIK